MEGVSIKGLVLGFAAMVVLDTLVMFGLTIAVGGPMITQGMTAEQMRNMTPEQMRQAGDAIGSSTAFLTGSLILGTLTTVVGGYIAGRVGSVAPYLNAGLLGVLGLLLSLFLARGYPAWFVLLGLVAVFPAALLGGHFAARGMERKA